MALEYINRRGDRYYVLQGKTKTGKPKYYCSKKPGQFPVDRLPEDFELHENPANGLVSVRKVRPSLILPFERESLANWAAELAATDMVMVEVEGDSLVVYASDTDPDNAIRTMQMLLGPMGDQGDSHRDWIVRHSSYSPCFRFSLTEEDERLYSAERWCYRGSMDGWHMLAEDQPLDLLARLYLPHLGQESYFDLM